MDCILVSEFLGSKLLYSVSPLPTQSTSSVSLWERRFQWICPVLTQSRLNLSREPLIGRVSYETREWSPKSWFDPLLFKWQETPLQSGWSASNRPFFAALHYYYPHTRSFRKMRFAPLIAIFVAHFLSSCGPPSLNYMPTTFLTVFCSPGVCSASCFSRSDTWASRMRYNGVQGCGEYELLSLQNCDSLMDHKFVDPFLAEFKFK
jgi:hypothetical protein